MEKSYIVSCKSDPRFDMEGTYETESNYALLMKVIDLVLDRAEGFGIDEGNLPDDLIYNGWFLKKILDNSYVQVV